MSEYSFNRSIKPASAFTAERNRTAKKELTVASKSEYELAGCGLIYPAKSLCVKDAVGHVVWDEEKYSFLSDDKAPDTVNAALWENGRCNALSGVFEVVPGAIYQVRGLDLANLTIVRGKTGWIVLDCMTTIETARASLLLFEEALCEDISGSIRAVIISHPHIDHYGGIKGIIDEENAGSEDEGRIPIYVPEGFEDAAVREHVFAGPAMSRRSPYQTGRYLSAGPKGLVSTGIGSGSARGTYSYIAPTHHIKEDCTLAIDGLSVDFQLTPGTEAPVEMNNYFADYRALWMAENCSASMHNISPLRGAKIRDAAAWASYILMAEQKYASRSDVVFMSHNWPRFNTKEEPHAVSDFLTGTAAAYKYIHDRTLMLANRGLSPGEAAKASDIPAELVSDGYTMPYYGSYRMNSRAVYAGYLGVWSADPTDIDPLSEKEEAELFVEYGGGIKAVIKRAVKDFENGEYQRAANAAYKVHLADPEDKDARYLAADAFEQLGYASCCGTWRNAYLTFAMDLRAPEGETAKRAVPDKGTDLEENMSADLLLSKLGICLDQSLLGDENFSFSLTITDEPDGPACFEVRLYKGILLTVRAEHPRFKDYCRMPREGLIALINKDFDSLRHLTDTNIPEKLAYLSKAVVCFYK